MDEEDAANFLEVAHGRDHEQGHPGAVAEHRQSQGADDVLFVKACLHSSITFPNSRPHTLQ